MSYDLHIIRTDKWLDAESNPITKSDVDHLLSSEPDLQWSTTDYVDMRDTKNGTINRYFMILWNGDPVFWWYKAEIRCSNPQKAQIIKMVQIARALDAKVVGDEEEEYSLVKKSSGPEEFVTLNA